MMNISEKIWKKYIDNLARISETAKELVEDYVKNNDIDSQEGRKSLIDYAYQIGKKYGTANAEYAAQMYDALAELEGMLLDPAELAEFSSYIDVAKAVNATSVFAARDEQIGAAVSRLVKLQGQDTTLKNAVRDGAYYAWIPSGDTCAFCIALASRGWERASKATLKNGHAEHIHANCDCSFAVKFSPETNFRNYNPDTYKKIYYSAEGRSAKDRINSIRREAYQINKDEINEQKREAYARRKELESSKAEEVNLNNQKEINELE